MSTITTFDLDRLRNAAEDADAATGAVDVQVQADDRHHLQP